RETAPVDRPKIEQDGSARRDLAGHDVARRELVGEAVALLVEQERTLAAQGLRQEQRRIDERRRRELHELEIGERGTRSVRRRHPLADRAGGVRRPLPEGGGAARREQ